jgi:hypothetical protein
MPMKSRVAWIIAGLAMMSIAFLHSLAANEAGEPQQSILLGSLGMALIAGGVLWSRPAMLVALIMILVSGAVYLHARDVQRQEQAVLDREWEEVARQAIARKALPGARPSPASLKGMPVVIGLLVSGFVLGGWAVRRGIGRIR